MDNQYYLYLHYKADSEADCFYVGIGKKCRAWSDQGRTHAWHLIVAKHGLRVRIVEWGMEKEDALAFEGRIISQWISYGIPLINVQKRNRSKS